MARDRLVISTGKKKGQHPSPATVMRMLRDHDGKTAMATVLAGAQEAAVEWPPRGDPRPASEERDA